MLASDEGNLGHDIEVQPTRHICTGDRMRLHYPMLVHDGARYMKRAYVHPVTGQFEFHHVLIYKEVSNGSPPERFVSEFVV